ncbi:MAG TPA: hypothetical protein VK428_14870 [Acidimicrobiales bacterium]|nr:hypothetical protein [Acidimicrobiales bacterium]
MTVTTLDEGFPAEPHPEAHGESVGDRHRKEQIALWLFIAGDAVLLVLEVFTWIYTRALNTDGMWRGAACTAANPCTDGLGNPLTHEVAKANPWYSVGVLALVVVAAALLASTERSARRRSGQRVVSNTAAMALAALLAGIALQCYQFTALPFSTIDGTYASSFEFFMGSTLAHLFVLGLVAVGVWNRARLGRYGDGHWQQLRLIRIFGVWIAASIAVLVFVMSVFS